MVQPYRRRTLRSSRFPAKITADATRSGYCPMGGVSCCGDLRTSWARVAVILRWRSQGRHMMARFVGRVYTTSCDVFHSYAALWFAESHSVKIAWNSCWATIAWATGQRGNWSISHCSGVPGQEDYQSRRANRGANSDGLRLAFGLVGQGLSAGGYSTVHSSPAKLPAEHSKCISICRALGSWP